MCSLLRPLALLTCLTVPAAAQSVQGRVLDRGSDRAMGGVSVELLARDAVQASTTTDADGLFTMAAGAAGTYRLSVRQDGRPLAVSRDFVVSIGDTARVELRVLAGGLRLEPLVAVAQPRRLPGALSAFYERAERSGGGGRFLTRDAIDARRASRTSDLLRNMPGFSFGQNRRGGTSMRSRGCEPMVWVDGQQLPTNTMSLDDVVQPQDIEGIEVYSGPASLPADFVRRGAPSCGAVLVWTRYTG